MIGAEQVAIVGELDRDSEVIDPPDWMLGGGGTIVSQRTINAKIYRCTATG